ncbi:MAG: Calx-beta domain-containing protein, partial [Mariprofundaceae bacterium]
MYSWLKVLFVLVLLAGCNNNSGSNNTVDGVGEEAPSPEVVASMLSLSELTVSQGAGMVTLSFKAMLDKASESEVTGDYLISSHSVSTTLASRAFGDDIIGTFTISVGATETTVTIEINDVGGNTGFNLTASNVQGAILDLAGASVDVTFIAPTPPLVPALSIVPTSVSEGASGSKNLSFTVTLDQVTTVDITVDYATANITATAGSDYTATDGTLTIPAGSVTATIDVPVKGDTLVESNER